MARQSVDFAAALSFARPVPAPVVDATGATVTAPAGTARFTHDPTSHALLGILIEAADENGAPDLLAIADASWVTAGRKTVLHHWFDSSGAERRDVHFTDDPRATIDGLQRLEGVHRLCLEFGFLPTLAEDLDGDTHTLVRDGDAVTYLREPDQVWTVVTGLLATAAAEHLLTAPGERVITGAPE